MKTTPSPWYMSPAFFDQKNEEPWFRVYGSHTLFLTVRADCDGYVKGANEANARLISAAPDLLTACEVSLYPLSCYLGENNPAVNAMREAILKATGETK